MDKLEQLNRETAAAIGVALALALNQSNSNLPSNPEKSPWRTIARSEQLLSRNSGLMDWH